MTGIVLSMRVRGPCLSSPARMPSECMYVNSLIFYKKSTQILTLSLTAWKSDLGRDIIRGIESSSPNHLVTPVYTSLITFNSLCPVNSQSLIESETETPKQGSTLTFKSTCPIGQVLEKVTCPHFLPVARFTAQQQTVIIWEEAQHVT